MSYKSAYTGAQIDAAIGLMTGARFYIGTTTHDMSSTADQAITGVGFTPTTVIFLAGVDAAGQASIGVGNSGMDNCITNHHNVTANSWAAAGSNPATSSAVYIEQSGSAYCSARIKTLDADGFTLAWSKTGSPTGTATIAYLAIK